VFFTHAEGACGAHKYKMCKRGPPFQVIRADEARNDTIELASSDSVAELFHLWCKPKTCYDIVCTFKNIQFPILKRFIGNSASLVIITKGNNIDEGRVEDARKQCSKCLYAHYNSDPSFFPNHSTSLRTYDLVAWDYVIGGTKRYSGENTTEYGQAILEDLKAKGREILKKTGKPSLVFLKVSKATQPIWENSDVYNVLRYVLLHKDELIDSGIFSMVYAEWDGGSSYSLVNNEVWSEKSDYFCNFEKTVDLYLVPQRYVTTFLKVDMEDNVPMCEVCSDLEKSSSSCTKTCLTTSNNGNHVQCQSIPGVPDEDQKCPPVAVKDCDLCSDLMQSGKSILCTYYYPNGTQENVAYVWEGFMPPITVSYDKVVYINNDNVYLYPDVFGALPYGEHCCIEHDGETYTYLMQTFKQLLPSAITFPTNGNENTQCGLSHPTTKVCNKELPIKNYRVECKWV